MWMSGVNLQKRRVIFCSCSCMAKILKMSKAHLDRRRQSLTSQKCCMLKPNTRVSDAYCLLIFSKVSLCALSVPHKHRGRK